MDMGTPPLPRPIFRLVGRFRMKPALPWASCCTRNTTACAGGKRGGCGSRQLPASQGALPPSRGHI